MAVMKSWILAGGIIAIAGGPLAADDSSVHKDGLRENTPDVWALIHAKVVAEPGVEIDDATIVIRDGKIDSVQSGGVLPSDARVVDFSGKTIYPGLIDAYGETSIPGSFLKQTAGYWNPNVVPHLSLARRTTENTKADELREQGVVAQLRAPGDAILRGQSALCSTGTDKPSRTAIAEDVAQHLELTVSRRSRDSFPGSPMGAVALCRQAFYDAQWYQAAWNAATADSSLRRPERNVALAALKPVLAGKQPVIIECSNELFVLRADRFAAEFGLNAIIRASGREYRRLKEIAATKRTLILPVNFPDAPNVSTPEDAEDATLEALMHWDIAPENPARVHAAGITFAFTSNRLSTVKDFLSGVRKAVKRGLPADVALKALTSVPAHLFGVSDQLGSVTRGKLASFVVTDGDLFDTKTKVLETWIDGSRFQHTPDPIRRMEGVYRLELSNDGDDKLPSELFVELSRQEKSVSGRVALRLAELTADTGSSDHGGAADNKKKEKTSPVEIKDPVVRDYGSTGRFTSDGFGQSGVAQLSMIFSEKPKHQHVGFGKVVWPDGRSSTVKMFAANLHPKKSKSSDAAGSDEDNQTVTAEAKKSDEKASFPVNYPLGAFGRTSLPKADDRVALVNATIWTCGPAGVISNGTLLIQNGQILKIGRKVKLRKSTKVIDVQGAHVTPGIIDCHSHMASDGGINESTQAITCEVRIGDFVDCDDITIYRQLAGGVTSSNILHGSANPIGGQNQVIKLRWGAGDEVMKFAEAPPGVKFALGENVKQSNRGDDYTTRYPQTRMGVEQLFRDAFAAARDYEKRHDDWMVSRRGLPPRRDLELDALVEIVNGKRWIHCHSYRQDEILALIRVLDEHDITIGTFQHILEGYKVADAMAKHGAMGSAFSDWWAYKFEVYDAIPYAGALMHNAGVVVSFNSDDAELGTRLNTEAAKAVKYGGVSEEEALKFVTLNPAKQLRIDKYVGSLEKGKHADFVVWNGHPLSGFTRCEQTWIDGVRYFDRTEDAEVRRVNADMRNTLIQKILTTGAKMRGVGEDDDDPSSQWLRHDEFCHHGHDHRHVHKTAK